MIEDILRDWGEWDVPFTSVPRLQHALTRGRTNQSYLIEADERLWVLRVSAPNCAHLGIDRDREAVILKSAVAAGIAPELAYCSVERGILITGYIDGRHWQTGALDDLENFKCLLNLIQRVHALEVDAPPIDYYVHAEYYWSGLIDAHVDIPNELCREREQMLAQREAYPAVKSGNSLCHHDPTPENVIDRDGRLYLLDWEYAARGSTAFDYAAIAIEWEVPFERLQEYAGTDLDELTHAATLYRHTCRLWTLLQKERRRMKF